MLFTCYEYNISYAHARLRWEAYSQKDSGESAHTLPAMEALHASPAICLLLLPMLWSSSSVAGELGEAAQGAKWGRGSLCLFLLQ